MIKNMKEQEREWSWVEFAYLEGLDAIPSDDIDELGC